MKIPIVKGYMESNFNKVEHEAANLDNKLGKMVL